MGYESSIILRKSLLFINCLIVRRMKIAEIALSFGWKQCWKEQALSSDGSSCFRLSDSLIEIESKLFIDNYRVQI